VLLIVDKCACINHAKGGLRICAAEPSNKI